MIACCEYQWPLKGNAIAYEDICLVTQERHPSLALRNKHRGPLPVTNVYKHRLCCSKSAIHLWLVADVSKARSSTLTPQGLGALSVARCDAGRMRHAQEARRTTPPRLSGPIETEMAVGCGEAAMAENEPSRLHCAGPACRAQCEGWRQPEVAISWARLLRLWPPPTGTAGYVWPKITIMNAK